MAITFTTQSKFGKAFSRLHMIVCDFFEKGRHYSWRLAVYNTAWWVGNYCHPLVCLQFWGKLRITEWMDCYISKHNLCPSDKLSNPYDAECAEKYRIWVFWWQGEDSMPELVKGCYKQLCSHNQNVVLVARENLRQYCQIPQYIYERVENGSISFTHFSDIVRVTLLAAHGGMWVDATCWVTGEIPSEVRRLPLISPKTLNAPDFPWWSNSRWCGWCMGTAFVRNPLFVFVRDFFFSFYSTNSNIPFYLFIDYLYDYAWRKIPEVRQMLDAVPENNVKRGQLHFILNKPWNQQEYEQLVKNNWVFKLSYKTKWKTTCNGQPTFYAKLVCQHTSPTI